MVDPEASRTPTAGHDHANERRDTQPMSASRQDRAIEGQRPEAHRHTVRRAISHNDDNTQNGDPTIQFQPCSDVDVQAMTAAIWAHGWEQGSISHGVNVRKGPLYLQWGKVYGG